MSYSYLASPYSHSEAAVQQSRYEEARRAAAWLLERRQWCYAPIVHCHDLALNHSLPYTFDFWEVYNKAMIMASYRFVLLQIDGWQESKGIRGEVEYALQRRLPMAAMRPEVEGGGYIVEANWDPKEFLGRTKG